MALQLQLRLYDDAGNEAALPAGEIGSSLGGWHIQSAPVRAQSLMPYAVHDGPAVHERTRDLVSETANVWIRKQATPAALRAKIQAIETLVEKANQGSTVWVEYDTSEASDNAWRSPLMAGNVAWQADMRLRLRNSDAQVQVSYSREPWWEGDSRTAQLARGASLVNASAPSVSHAGRVSARASNDDGILPAPLKLTWTLPTTSVEELRFYVAQRYDASDSNAGVYTVATTLGRTNIAAETESALLTAAVPSGTGGWRRVVVEATGNATQRTSDRDGPLWLRAGLGTADEQIERASWVRAGYYEGRESRFSDLGPLYISRSHLWLRAWSDTAIQTSSMRIHLLPTDGYRAYYVAGDSLAGGTLIDENGELSGTAAGPAMSEGEPILLTPGRASEFVLLSETEDGSLPGSMTVAATYRPRRLSI